MLDIHIKDQHYVLALNSQNTTQVHWSSKYDDTNNAFIYKHN